ncbi:MAG: FAD synthase [Thaumarchaeota archaeon]|nr:FAD synthase [Nitrososphaerota archaeon]
MEKRFLGEVYALHLLGREATVDAVARRMGTSRSQAAGVARRLANGKMVGSEGGKLRVTPKGRKRIKVVFIGGGFEVIHPGHLHTIEGAKALGDVLVVVAARDSTIRKRKGREPISGERQRVKLLSALRPVDAVLLGVEGNIYRTLAKVAPDIVALGYDQHHQEAEILREGHRLGMKFKVVRLGSPIPSLKTTRILDVA